MDKRIDEFYECISRIIYGGNHGSMDYYKKLEKKLEEIIQDSSDEEIKDIIIIFFWYVWRRPDYIIVLTQILNLIMKHPHGRYLILRDYDNLYRQFLKYNPGINRDIKKDINRLLYRLQESALLPREISNLDNPVFPRDISRLIGSYVHPDQFRDVVDASIKPYRSLYETKHPAFSEGVIDIVKEYMNDKNMVPIFTPRIHRPINPIRLSPPLKPRPNRARRPSKSRTSKIRTKGPQRSPKRSRRKTRKSK